MPAKKTKNSSTLSAGEKAALRETIAERKRLEAGADGEKMLLESISRMKEADRAMAKRLHEIVKTNAPHLMPKTWYGMPAYGKGPKGEQVVLFFKETAKFKERYATLGFNGPATLDDGNMWATSYALTKLTPAEEAKIAALVKKAAR